MRNVKVKKTSMNATLDPNDEYEKGPGYNGGRESASTAARTHEK